MLQGERTDTDLVLAVTGGERSAFGELFDRWFNSSWNVARNILRDDDLAADIAQDALLNAWQQLDQLQNPDAFGGWLLRITRNRALNRLERERRSKATGDDVVSGLRDAGAPDPTGAERPLGPDAISEVRDRQELLWAAAGALGEREASLLDLHLRHGLGPAEIAEELGVEANNAHQQLYRLRTKLGEAVGSYLLWRNGRPLCDGLAAAVSGDVAFDKSVARAVARHQKSCDACAERRSGLVDPSKLFAAVPLVLVPSHLKANAAAALDAAGVPTDPSGSASSADGNGSTEAGSANGSAESGTTPDGGSHSTGSNGDPGAGGSGGGGSNAGGNASPGSGGGGSASGGGGGSGAGGPGTGGLGNVGAAGTPATPASGGTSVLATTADSAGPTFTTALAETTTKGKILSLVGAGAVAAIVVGFLGYFLLDNGDETATAAVVQAGLENLADDQNPLEDPAGPSGSAGDSGDGATGDFTPPADTGASDDQAPAAAEADSPNPIAPATPTEDPVDDAPSTTEPEPVTTTEPEPETTTTQPDTTTTTTEPDSTTTEPETTTTERDPDPITTDPVRDPTTTEPEEVTTTTEEEPIVTTPVDKPKIVRFDSRRSLDSTQACESRNQTAYDALWATEGAEKAELTIKGVTKTVAASGSHTFCGAPGERIGLVVRNSAGEDKARTTL